MSEKCKKEILILEYFSNLNLHFQKTSAQAIAQNMAISIFPCLIFTWTPILEEDFGQERFVTDDPNVLFRAGNFSRVNALMGITAHEFVSPAAGKMIVLEKDLPLTTVCISAVLYNPVATAYLNDNWDRIAPTCFYFQGNEFTSTEEMSTILRESYFPYDFIDIRSFNGLNSLFADSIIGYGVHKFVHLVNAFIDVYYYKFSYVGESSFFEFPRNRPYGVHHGDDLQYLFNFAFQGVAIPLTHPDSFVVERITRIYEQFAWFG